MSDLKPLRDGDGAATERDLSRSAGLDVPPAHAKRIALVALGVSGALIAKTAPAATLASGSSLGLKGGALSTTIGAKSAALVTVQWLAVGIAADDHRGGSLLTKRDERVGPVTRAEHQDLVGYQEHVASHRAPRRAGKRTPGCHCCACRPRTRSSATSGRRTSSSHRTRSASHRSVGRERANPSLLQLRPYRQRFCRSPAHVRLFPRAARQRR